MSQTSNLFIIFIALSLVLYYLFPRRIRWYVLLLTSLAFYLYASSAAVLFLIVSLVSSWAAAGKMYRNRQAITDRKQRQRHNKGYLLLNVMLNLGLLLLLKYNGTFSGLFQDRCLPHKVGIWTGLLVPLGISYYTLQIIGYLLDVYWEREDAESNLLKYSLFVSWFPQLVQGPIGRFSHLKKELLTEHDLDFHQIKLGTERIVWGLFKKMVIAEWASVYRTAIFSDPEMYAGVAVLGTLFYSIELYADFSGGIDVVLGVSELFGIHLMENFTRPYFSVSLSAFWKRWHISLGSWMRDYVMYPLTLSDAMKRLGRTCRKAMGNRLGPLIPICISNLVVFFLVGVWHGPTWNNIAWGCYNGIVLSAGILLGGF